MPEDEAKHEENGPLGPDLDIGETRRGLVAGDTLFGRYTVEKILGRGAMGVVWLAKDNTLGRDMALKFLPHLVCLDEAMFEEMKAEVRRCLDLTHPNIVRTHDIAHDDQYAAISMEYVDGKPLSSVRAQQENGYFEAESLEPILKQLVNALSYAHEEAKIVHRDLKPANVMMTGDGAVKLADFGISRSISDTVTRVTMQRSGSGTLAYMSPQQAMGEVPSVGDDIYSLAAMVYDLMTSKPPFFTGDVITQIERVQPPPMSERRQKLDRPGDKIPQSWERAVARALSKDAEDRHRSVAEFWSEICGEKIDLPSRPVGTGPGTNDDSSSGDDLSALETVQRKMPPLSIDSRRSSSTAPIQTSGAKPLAEFGPDAAGAGPENRQKKSGTAIAAVIALLLVVLGGGAFFLMSKNRADSVKAAYVTVQVAVDSSSSPAERVTVLEDFLASHEQGGIVGQLTTTTIQQAKATLEQQAQLAEKERVSASEAQKVLANQLIALSVLNPSTLEDHLSLEGKLKALSERLDAIGHGTDAEELATLRSGATEHLQSVRTWIQQTRRKQEIETAVRSSKRQGDLENLEAELSALESLALTPASTLQAVDARKLKLKTLTAKLARIDHVEGDKPNQKELLARVGMQTTAAEEALTTLLLARKKEEEKETNKTRESDALVADAPFTLEMKKTAVPELPSSPAVAVADPPAVIGSTDTLFEPSRYSDYGSYGKEQILSRIQDKLKAEGLYTSSVDGEPGPSTHRALLGYQQKVGLPQTGQISDPLLAKLDLQNEPDRQRPAPKSKPRTTSPKKSVAKSTTPAPKPAQPAPKPPPAASGEMSREEFLRRARALR